MRYIVKVVNLCPLGKVIGTYFWIAENETNMQAMLKLRSSFNVITCLGPETELCDDLKNKLKEIEPSSAVDA